MGAKHTTRHLSIDLETYSSEDLQSVGLYKYCESPDFQVLLFAYSIDGGEVEVLDLASGDTLDDDMIRMLNSPNVLKHAYNAQFERVCLSRHLKIALPADQWRCTQVLASMHGLPGHLAEVGPALGISNEKHAYGKALIQYFSKPVTPTKVNHMRTRNLPHHDPDKWALFKEYCAQDVRAEMEIADRLNAQGIDLYTEDLNEQHLYTLDQIINDRGIRVQMDLVQNVINYHQQYTNELMESAKELTGLDNPKSNAQVKGWLAQRDVEVGSLNKESVEKLMEDELDDDVSAMLSMRKELSKTSMAKYDTLYRATCIDGRIRGVLQYYGANRSGRWAGRLVQVQNLPRNYLKELDAVRQLAIRDDFDSLNMIYDALSDILSQLIRTTLIPTKGRKFAIADYSAIEARVIAWLANEPWRREVFAGHGKIYEASASQMFKIPLENITKDLRQSGKVAELSCGFGGGPQALAAMGALKMGLKEEDLPGVVRKWRKANPNITALWANMEEALIQAVMTGREVKLSELHKQTPADVRFAVKNNNLYVTLPSGRKLVYQKIRVTETAEGRYSIEYMGVNQTTRKWSLTKTYGGKLVENCVQAIARDCLAHTLLQLDEHLFTIVFHVHDEVICETDDPDNTVEKMKHIMAQEIPWAKGLTLKAEAYHSDYYVKD